MFLESNYNQVNFGTWKQNLNVPAKNTWREIRIACVMNHNETSVVIERSEKYSLFVALQRFNIQI